MNQTLDIQPGDIVIEVATSRERTVSDVHLELGLIAFEDAPLQSWTSMEGWIPTGRRAK